MTNEPMAMDAVPYDKTMYPGYVARFGASLLDILIMAPFSIFIVYLNSLSKDMYYFTMIPSLAFSMWFHIYLLKRYGATPGKLISGIRVIKTDGQFPEWKEAFLRFTLSLIFLIFGIVISLVALAKADAGYFDSSTWRQKTGYLKTLSPELFTISVWLYNLFFWSDIMVLFRNRRKRALHDLMAGTVVVRDLYLKKLRLNESAFEETPD